MTRVALILLLAAGRITQAQVVERVIAVSDSTQSYALFRPPPTGPDVKHPILFVLDPRGRAPLGISLFRRGAAELGFVIMSSYESRSDADASATVRSMNAMLADAQSDPSIDASRIYIAGMSGTARLAAAFAVEARPHVAGVFSASAGLPGGSPVEMVISKDGAPAFFLTAGSEDFNYLEVRAFGQRLVEQHVPTQLHFFRGGHGWPDESACYRSMRWFNLRAALTAKAPVDSDAIRMELDAELAGAMSLEGAGRLDEAQQGFAAVASEARGWPQALKAGEASRRLLAARSLKTLRDDIAEAGKKEQRQSVRLQSGLRDLRRNPDPVSAAEVVKLLGLNELRRRGASADSVDAPAAKRGLAAAFVQLAFYEPRAYLAAGEYHRALTLLDAAQVIQPLSGAEVCTLVKQARSGAGVSDAIGAACR